jgi:acyl-CoA thioester hydrolase
MFSEEFNEPIFKLFNPELDLQNWSLILASYKVDFLEQIYYGQKVQVRTFISRIGTSSFDVYQELWQQQKKCASGVTTMVHFDYQSKQALAITEDIKARLLANSYPD